MPPAQVAERKAVVKRKLRERRVPSSPLGRVFGFAQLGAGLVYGSVSDSVSSVSSHPPLDSHLRGKLAGHEQVNSRESGSLELSMHVIWQYVGRLPMCVLKGAHASLPSPVPY